MTILKHEEEILGYCTGCEETIIEDDEDYIRLNSGDLFCTADCHETFWS